MSYGIISIISYLVFLVWVIATYNDGDGTVEYKPIGSGAVNLAAAMGAAFSIQMFFIPILKKNPKPKRYTFYTALAYTFGSFAYYYIAYIGSVGTFVLIKAYGIEPILKRRVANKRLRAILPLVVGR